jgi:hypothetical protein
MHLLHPTEVFSTLSSHIDPKNIPRKYGGELNYSFGDMPVLDPDLIQGFTWSNGVDRLPIGPIKWEEDGDGGMKMIAVGSKRGKKRRLEVGRLSRGYGDVFFPTGEVPRGKASH